MSRTCDAIGCSAAVTSGRFMCIKHWRMVPLQLQRTINTRYRACLRNFSFLSDVEYLQAAVLSIDQIARAEGHAQEGEPAVGNPYRKHLVLAIRRAAAPRVP
jgi:hypothetical protein